MEAGPSIFVHQCRAGYRSSQIFGRGVEHLVIDGLDFEFKPGIIYGIFGPNGGGKTTFLRALSDADFRFSGEVLFDGLPLKKGQVGYLPQAPTGTLSPWQTILQEAALPLRIGGTPKAIWEQRIRDILKETLLDIPINRKIANLSGGQRVTTALVRGLAVPDLKLFVADEPFEGLDEDSRHSLIQHVRRIADKGIPVVITSHRSEDFHLLQARLFTLEGVPVRSLREAKSGFAYKSNEPSNRTGQRDILSKLSAAKRKESVLVRLQPLLLGGTGILIGIIAWAIAAMVVRDAGLLPGPLSVGKQLYRLMISPISFGFSATFFRAFSGWLVSNLVAIPVGILLGFESRIYRLFSPWLSVGRAIPVFALVAPAAGLFPNFPETQRIFLIWLTLFLTSLQIVATATTLAPRRRAEVARIFGAGRWFILSNVMPYEAISGIFAALEVTLPLSIVLTFVLETFLIPPSGLGVFLFNHLNDPDLSLFFAHMLLPAILAAIALAAIRSFSKTFRFDS